MIVRLCRNPPNLPVCQRPVSTSRGLSIAPIIKDFQNDVITVKAKKKERKRKAPRRELEQLFIQLLVSRIRGSWLQMR